jgi:membrane protein YqaA with SNARE-associated domain
MLELMIGLFLASVVSGFIPFVNAEILVVGAAMALPSAGVPLIALVSTLGQMTSKTALFGLARWAPAKLSGKESNALGRATESLKQYRGSTWGLILISAVTGLPSFYGTSLAAGAVKVPVQIFVTAGSLGRFFRFGAIAWFGDTVIAFL